MFCDLKAIHLRTLNRDRAEMLADHFLCRRSILSPADIAKREAILLPSAFDRGPIAVRFVSISDLYAKEDELASAAAACQGGFVMRLCRRQHGQWRRALMRRVGLPFAHSDWYIGLALHKDVTKQQALAALLAGCAARRELLSQPPGKHEGRAWWGGEGDAVIRACACVERGRQVGLQQAGELATALEDQGWQSKVLLLGKSERVRFSTKVRRSPGGVRWVSFPHANNCAFPEQQKWRRTLV